jgi:hypothetical protein
MLHAVRLFAAAFALAAMAASPSSGVIAQSERNPSPYIARSEPISGVRKIKVEGAINVLVMSGQVPESSVTFSGPPELLADAVTRIEDGVLTISFREGADWSWNSGSGMNVVVRLPALEGIETNGPAQVETVNLSVAVPTFSATVNGAGKIAANDVRAENVQLAVGGSGSIRISGTAGDVAYATGGAGSIDAKRLRATNGAISLGGPGAVFADISGAADINVGGPGTVEVVGGATCTTRAPRPSQVECR